MQKYFDSGKSVGGKEALAQVSNAQEEKLLNELIIWEASDAPLWSPRLSLGGDVEIFFIPGGSRSVRESP